MSGFEFIGWRGQDIGGNWAGFFKVCRVFGEGRDVQWQVTKSQSSLDVLSCNQLQLSACGSSVTSQQLRSQAVLLYQVATGFWRSCHYFFCFVLFSLIRNDFKYEWNFKWFCLLILWCLVRISCKFAEGVLWEIQARIWWEICHLLHHSHITSDCNSAFQSISKKMQIHGQDEEAILSPTKDCFKFF